MITSIQNMIDNTPIDWHWKHVAGHQDDKTDLLDRWVERNIQMDAEAKAFWTQLHDQGFQHCSCHLPGEGWTIWIDQKKLTSLNRSDFNKLTQSKYSTEYWQQENKLGNKLDTIDWYSIDKVQSSLPIQCQIWMTKWATGWLPTGTNMKKWKQWPTDQCPVCKDPNMRETVEHLIQCNHFLPQSLIYQHIERSTEELADLITMGFPVQEFLMAMFQLPYCQKLSDHYSQAVDLQYTLSPKWTARGCVSKNGNYWGPRERPTGSALATGYHG